MAGPAAVVVAGTITAWLAISSSDGLVAEDYYRRGLAINRDLRKERAASDLGVETTVELREGVLRVFLKTRGARPAGLVAQLVHPTRAGEDRRLRLALVAPETYEAHFDAPAGARWRLVLEDERGEWRVVKEGL